MNRAQQHDASAPAVIILGAGPAGISCALWLHGLEIPFRWLCAGDRVGGTLLRVGNPVANYPGVPAKDGPELVSTFEGQLASANLKPEFGAQALRIDQEDRHWSVMVDRGTQCERLTCEALVVATGTKPRMLGLEHEHELLGHGVEISVTRNRERYAGQEVCIVGGGDAALEGALILQDHCPRIHLIHRRTRFPAQRRFVERVQAADNIVMHLDQEVQRILPAPAGSALEAVELKDGRQLSVSGLFVRIGVRASYPEGLPSACIADDGYVLVDDLGRTPLRGLYASGDLTGAAHQSVASAVGGGARCATAIQQDRRTR